jgi:hypothetical protein
LPLVPESRHPLDPALTFAREAADRFTKVHDYSCTLVKRERVDGRLIAPQRLMVKVRQRPFSVYLKQLTPRSLAGQEVIYVEGENDNKLVAHTTGLKHRFVGAVKLKLDGAIAMHNNRYPITEIGILRLLERVIEVGQDDRNDAECRVTYFDRRSVDGRPCSGVEVVHPEAKAGCLYHLARVYIDEELQVPIRFEAYTWPEEGSDELRLVEEYTYTDLRLNEGFDDDDFSPQNQAYAFARAGHSAMAQQ